MNTQVSAEILHAIAPVGLFLSQGMQFGKPKVICTLSSAAQIHDVDVCEDDEKGGGLNPVGYSSAHSAHKTSSNKRPTTSCTNLG